MSASQRDASRPLGSSDAEESRSVSQADASLMFGPADAELPVLCKIRYHIEAEHVSVETPAMNGMPLEVKVSLSGADVIKGLQALYTTGTVPHPYPSHLQKIASLGRSEVKVKLAGSSSSRSSES